MIALAAIPIFCCRWTARPTSPSYALGYTDYARGQLPFWDADTDFAQLYMKKYGIEYQQDPTHKGASWLKTTLGAARWRYNAIASLPYTSALVQHFMTNDTLQTEVIMPEDVQKALLTSFAGRVTRFHNMVAQHNVCHISMLQPMALDALFPFNSKRQNVVTKTLAGIPRAVALDHSDKGGRYDIGPLEYFLHAADTYAELNKKYPGAFIDMSKAFYNVDKDIYGADSIHYQQEGSEILAKAIFEAMRARLSKPSQPHC
jgi:hypothetical protein